MYKKGFITGCFDIVHPGHLRLFKFAKKHCEYLVVGVENDEFIKSKKGVSRPIFNLDQRIKFLKEIRTVDEVIALGTNHSPDYYLKLMQKLKVDCLITNPNFDKDWEMKKAQLGKIGIAIVLDRSKVDTSTSKIADLVVKNFS
jgi:D-beta-D-heptose 7-phosphate kinase/D-beta-D-heptose 1-phosphate adenosyltransferase